MVAGCDRLAPGRLSRCAGDGGPVRRVSRLPGAGVVLALQIGALDGVSAGCRPRDDVHGGARRSASGPRCWDWATGRCRCRRWCTSPGRDCVVGEAADGVGRPSRGWCGSSSAESGTVPILVAAAVLRRGADGADAALGGRRHRPPRVRLRRRRADPPGELGSVQARAVRPGHRTRRRTEAPALHRAGGGGRSTRPGPDGRGRTRSRCTTSAVARSTSACWSGRRRGSLCWARPMASSTWAGSTSTRR